MRKMFEELRSSHNLDNFNGTDIFSESQKAIDGTVHKDEFIYQLLDME